MNKGNRGYTLTELLAVIVILGVIMLIAVPIFTRYILKTEEDYYKDLEDVFTTAAVDYTTDNMSVLPKKAGEEYVIEGEEIDLMVKLRYMDKFTSSNGIDCEVVKMIIRRKSADDYDYVPCLICEDYKTADERCGFN